MALLLTLLAGLAALRAVAMETKHPQLKERCFKKVSAIKIMQPVPQDRAKQEQRLQESHRHGWLHEDSIMILWGLEHTRHFRVWQPWSNARWAPIRGKALDANTNSSTAHSETLGIKGLYLKHRFLSKFGNQKNVKGKRSNFHLIC